MLKRTTTGVFVLALAGGCSEGREEIMGAPSPGDELDGEGAADDGDPADDDGDDDGPEPGDGDGPEPGDGDGQTYELLTVQGIYQHVIDHEIDNVRDLLSALPRSMGDSYVLMEDTRSRHMADLEHPRLIMYGLDARFLMSAGGVPDDPLYEVIEMAELDAQTGQWIFRALDFGQDPPALGASDQSCQGCHGSPVRPIWGHYPDWPGAFGADENDLTAAQASVLLDLMDTQAQTDRYHHLQLPGVHEVANNRTFYLPSRAYGYANTSFNFELVVAHADGLVTRMSQASDWAARRYDLVEAFWCGTASAYEIMRQLGLDGPNDFQLDGPVFDALTGSDYEQFGWNQGSTGLIDVVIFRVIDQIARTDPQMAAALDAIEPTRSEWIRHWFELRGEERAQWLASFDLYDFDLRPQELVPRAAGPMCDYLASR